ncbi:hypothetical protein OAO18_00745 [Francisellaceae bacterium]|nr:hypothetical protein [Francisellaceae bacterium]
MKKIIIFTVSMLIAFVAYSDVIPNHSEQHKSNIVNRHGHYHSLRKNNNNETQHLALENLGVYSSEI